MPRIVTREAEERWDEFKSRDVRIILMHSIEWIVRAFVALTWGSFKSFLHRDSLESTIHVPRSKRRFDKIDGNLSRIKLSKL